MDLADEAQKIEAMALAEALASRVLHVTPGPEWVNGVAYCRECGDPIPEVRLKAVPGTGYCVDCAAVAVG